MQAESAGFAAKKRAIGLMVICSLMWSTGGVFIKMTPWNPLVLAGIRSLIAAGVFAVYMAVKRIRPKINRKSIVAGIMLAATYLFFVCSCKMTTAANAIVLQYTAPIFLVLISAVVYRQKFRRLDYFVVGVTICGIALCFLDRMGTGSALGNALGVASGFSLAGMYASTGNAESDTRVTGLFLGQSLCALIGAPLAFFFDTPITPATVAGILFLGIVAIGIPYVIYAIGVEDCSPLICCLIAAIEPLCNPIWVFLFDGEAPGLLAILGGAIVIGVVTLWNVLDLRAAARQQQDTAHG